MHVVRTARMPDLPTLTRAEMPGTERLLHLRQCSARATRGIRTRRRIDIFFASSASLVASLGCAAAWRTAAAASDSILSNTVFFSLGLTGQLWYLPLQKCSQRDSNPRRRVGNPVY